MITIINDGPLIVSSNYWASDYAAAGKLFASVNAGAIRLLVPPALRATARTEWGASEYAILSRGPDKVLGEHYWDLGASEYAILSRGPWPEKRLSEAVEILWEDGSESPYCLHLSPESFDLLPAEPEAGREWSITAWIDDRVGPRKIFERVCHWRRVPRVPWLKPWK